MGDSAAIYIANPSLLGSKFPDKFREIKSHQGLQDGERATGQVMDLV